MRICIATGIYPPATSGPAQYAAAMEAEFKKCGHTVTVVTYKHEHKLPTGVRHLWYFLRVFPCVLKSDLVFALDTFSVGLPATIAAVLLRKKILLRTGGDFLYEQFTERTKLPVLLSKFYVEKQNLSLKEKIIFFLTRWTLKNVSGLIFSTEWQRDIFMQPYKLEKQKIFVVENRFDEKISDEDFVKKNFIFATRNIAYKNIDRFKEAFNKVKIKNPEISLEFYHTLPHQELIEKMKTAYAVVMPSLGEISPHVILDAIRCNKPFLLTKESGFAKKLENVGVLIDPLDISDIAEKIEFLLNSENYKKIHENVRAFSFVHSWEEIADEILNISKQV